MCVVNFSCFLQTSHLSSSLAASKEQQQQRRFCAKTSMWWWWRSTTRPVFSSVDKNWNSSLITCHSTANTYMTWQMNFFSVYFSFFFFGVSFHFLFLPTFLSLSFLGFISFAFCWVRAAFPLASHSLDIPVLLLNGIDPSSNPNSGQFVLTGFFLFFSFNYDRTTILKMHGSIKRKKAIIATTTAATLLKKSIKSSPNKAREVFVWFSFTQSSFHWSLVRSLVSILFWSAFAFYWVNDSATHSVCVCASSYYLLALHAIPVLRRAVTKADKNRLYSIEIEKWILFFSGSGVDFRLDGKWQC